MLTRRQFGLAVALLAQSRPNLLFVVCGRWRRQALEAAVQKRFSAPNLGRFVRQSVEFTRAYSAHPSPGPAHAVLHTGRYPHSVSVPWDGRQLAQDYPSLASIFRRSGYKTGYFGRWLLDGGEPGPLSRRGFDSGSESDPSSAFTAREAGRQTDQALAFLAANKAAPHFLMVAFDGPFPPAGSSNRGAEASTLPDNVPAKDAAAARLALGGYYAQCAAIDESFGRLLDALEQHNLSSNTVVVFTSAHGEMLFSHGLEGAGSWHEESTAVPMLIRWPGLGAPSSSQDWLFNSVDLAPTLLGLCGLPAMEGAQGEDRSHWMRTQASGQRPESLCVQGELGTAREWRMLVRGWDKLVVGRDLKVTHLFNLAQDPFEKDNLAIDRATIRRQEELLALLRRWIIKTGDRVPYPERLPNQEKRQ